MAETATLTMSLTYAELVVLIAASGLKKGASYTITDFQTKHYIIDGTDVWLDPITLEPEIHSGQIEPLIVRAAGVNTLYNDAYSALYPADIIYYDWNPENWKYDIGFSNYDEAVLSGWKGVIHWRHFSLNDISAPGDWRNVKCRRWALAAPLTGFSTVYTAVASDAAGVVDADDYQDFLMFEETELDPIDKRVLGMTIPPFKDGTDVWFFNATILPNNVFHVAVNEGWWQIVGFRAQELCCNNTFAYYIEGVQIGSGFQENTIGNNFVTNTIGNLFQENTIGNSFRYNSISNSFQENTIGSNFESNTIGNNFETNTIGNYFSSNTVGNKFKLKTIGDSLTHFTIKDGLTSEVDLTSVSALYLKNYNCEFFKRQDGTMKIRYVDNSDADVIISLE